MKMRCFASIVAVAALFAVALAGAQAPAHAGSVGYVVTVDTTGLAGTSGYVETELNVSTPVPSPPGTPTVTATISNVTTDPTFMFGAATLTGDASGSFPSTVVLDNASVGPPVGFADLTQAVTYGKSLNFNLTLSGSDIGAPNSNNTNTTLSFILEDANFNGLNTGPLYNPGQPGEAFDIVVQNSNGHVIVMPNNPTTSPVPGYAPAADNGPVVTIGPLTSGIPEPSSVILLAAGIGGTVAVNGFRRRKAA